jgi:two-component system, cell cycle sensor histidine kinase and response regulator CckA
MKEQRADAPAAKTLALTYGAALIAVFVATLLRMALAPMLGPAAPFATYFVVILVVVWYCGFWPAMLAVVLSTVAGSYLFVSPATVSAFAIPTHTDRVTIAGFAIISIAVVFLLNLQRRTVDRANLEAERRKAAEEAEREQRNWFETTLASIGDAVIATDAEGKVLFMNSVANELTGWNTAEARGLSLRTVFHIMNEETGEEAENPADQVIRKGVTVGLANHTVLVAKNGRRIPIDDSGAPIKRGDRILGVVLVFRDVSGRRQSEQAAAHLAAVVETSDDAIITKTLDGRVLTWNAAAERIYGYSAGEAQGQTMSFLLPPERSAEEITILSQIAQGLSLDHFETTRIRKDGQKIDVSVTISPVRNQDNKIVAASHIARDITLQKRIEAQLQQTQKLESLGVLAGGVAHDFNNLLTGIVGNTSLVLETLSPNHPSRGPLQNALSASESAADLTRQLLAYAGKGRFVTEAINVSELIREISQLLQASIPKTVQLRLDLAKDVPYVEGDAGQIQQLIMNLVINGAEAVGTDQNGTVLVTTGLQELDETYLLTTLGPKEDLAPGTYVAIEVNDTGCGMDQATISRIFDPFFTTKFTGRGLGLAAAQGIVRGHKGTMKVYSQPGKGTSFKILFPATQKQPTRPTSRPAMEDFAGNAKILIIDDELFVRQAARSMLERYGYTVLEAENGREGIDLFRGANGTISLVILDMTMPVMSGDETLRNLRLIEPGVPVLLSSGYNEVEAIRRFTGKELAGFIQKPYTVVELLKTVRNALDTSRQMGSAGA